MSILVRAMSILVCAMSILVRAVSILVQAVSIMVCAVTIEIDIHLLLGAKITPVLDVPHVCQMICSSWILEGMHINVGDVCLQ